MLFVIKFISFFIGIISGIIGFKFHKKLLTCVSVIVIVYLLLCAILSLFFKLTLIPGMDKFITLFLVLGTLLIYAFSFNLEKDKMLMGLWIFAIFVVVAFVIIDNVFLAQFNVYETDENGNLYVGVGDKFTGVTESVVKYYRCYYDIFISTNCYYSENYGRVLSGWESIFNMEPYEVKYYVN